MDRIVIADDHPLFRAALTTALARAAPGAMIVETSSLAGARDALSAGPVDLLLLDLKLSDSEGFAGLTGIRADFPAAPVAIVSASEDDGTIRRALAFGAAGFIPKSATLTGMVEALEAILAGDVWAPGRLNKQIAFDLGVTEATIKAHLTGVFKKLGVQNRTQAVIAARALTTQV
jgi:DNA-binding NarL/FixJ family response regulator